MEERFAVDKCDGSTDAPAAGTSTSLGDPVLEQEFGMQSWRCGKVPEIGC
jgi:hypothetical protein